MKKNITLCSLLLIFGIAPFGIAPDVFAAPISRAEITGLIKTAMQEKKNNQDFAGFEDAADSGGVSCNQPIINSVNIIRSGKTFKSYFEDTGAYVDTWFKVTFEAKGSCNLTEAAKVDDKSPVKVIQGRVPYRNIPLEATISMDSYGDWFAGKLDTLNYEDRPHSETAMAYRQKLYVERGKNLQWGYVKGPYEGYKWVVTTPRLRLEAAIREHPYSNEVQDILSIIDRNPSVSKYMESLPYIEQQVVGRRILHLIKGIKDPQKRDQLSLRLVKEMKDGSYQRNRTARKKAKLNATSKVVKHSNPFKVSTLVDVSAGTKNIANYACVSEYGAGYRLANWGELAAYYRSPTQAEMDTLQHKYLISSAGREIGPNFGHRYAFYFKTKVVPSPAKTVTRETKMQALCIDKKSPVAKIYVAPTLHIHSEFVHDHELPEEGTRHRHGNGPIGR